MTVKRNGFIERAKGLFEYCNLKIKTEGDFERLDISRPYWWNRKKYIASKVTIINEAVSTFGSLYLTGNKCEFDNSLSSGLLEQHDEYNFRFLRKINEAEYNDNFYLGDWAMSENKIFKKPQEIHGLMYIVEKSEKSPSFGYMSELIIMSGYDDDDWSLMEKIIN